MENDKWRIVWCIEVLVLVLNTVAARQSDIRAPKEDLVNVSSSPRDCVWGPGVSFPRWTIVGMTVIPSHGLHSLTIRRLKVLAGSSDPAICSPV